MSEPTSVVLNILNRNYKVSCEEDQTESLCAAAEYLTRQLTVLDSTGAGERAYISIALSLSFDHLRTQDSKDKVRAKIRHLGTRIDSYINS